jgi:hypothetical protein
MDCPAAKYLKVIAFDPGVVCSCLRAELLSFAGNPSKRKSITEDSAGKDLLEEYSRTCRISASILFWRLPHAAQEKRGTLSIHECPHSRSLRVARIQGGVAAKHLQEPCTDVVDLFHANFMLHRVVMPADGIAESR